MLKVYIVNCSRFRVLEDTYKYTKGVYGIDNEKFKELANINGTVYSLKHFETVFNEGRDEIDNKHQCMRILESEEQ